MSMNEVTNKQKVFIETYGCQMNFSDSEIVASILKDNNYEITEDLSESDYILINTCSIRDNAEQRVRKRLQEFNGLKKKRPSLKVGILGCMAERLKTQLIDVEKIVDLVVGPDAYRELPQLLNLVEAGQKASNVILSEEETYAEISPVRLGTNGVSAFISIMRGCENFCAYCVVPYTRGKERSRDPQSIVSEAKHLFFEQGYREITLLGQNVNSFNWNNEVNFAQLMEKVAQIDPKLRVRFATSHPKDISDELLEVIAKYDNICKSIHLPVQSGSTRILELMRRKYTREWYLERIAAIKRIIPECSISTDVIVGFCSETEEDHCQTTRIFEEVGFDYAFMFKYSERPNTLAAKKMQDDVPDEEKTRRLEEVIELQQRLSHESNLRDVGKTFEVLVEGVSKKSADQLFGRNSQNKVVVFDRKNYKQGDYVTVKVDRKSVV